MKALLVLLALSAALALPATALGYYNLSGRAYWVEHQNGSGQNVEPPCMYCTVHILNVTTGATSKTNTNEDADWGVTHIYGNDTYQFTLTYTDPNQYPGGQYVCYYENSYYPITEPQDGTFPLQGIVGPYLNGGATYPQYCVDWPQTATNPYG